MQFVPKPPRLPGPLPVLPRTGTAPMGMVYGGTGSLVPDLPSPPRSAATAPATPGLNNFMGALFGQAPAPTGSEAGATALVPRELPRASSMPDWLRDGSSVRGALPLDPRIQLQSMLEGGSRSEIPMASAQDAARYFAGILFGYMFSEMRPKNEEDEGGLLGGGDSEMFMDFFDQAVGRHFADGAGGPLVEALVAQLSKASQK